MPRYITSKQLAKNALRLHSKGWLIAQEETAEKIVYHLRVGTHTCKCAIGASITAEENSQIGDQECSLQAIRDVSNFPLTFESIQEATLLQMKHDEWARERIYFESAKALQQAEQQFLSYAIQLASR